MKDRIVPTSFHKCSRFVYCRPVGGLNDTLCEIEKCWAYAEKNARALVIDTRVSGLMGQFSTYFSLNAATIPVFPTVTQELLDHLNSLTCYPEVLTGRLGKYTCTHIEEFEARVEIPSQTLLTFDLDKTYKHGVVQRETLGGGLASERSVQRITVLPEVREQVVKVLNELPRPYLGIHVRNTDYVTEYKSFFDQLLPKVTGRTVLVCSDDAEVIEYARKFFDLAKVISSSTTLVEKGSCLHEDISYPNAAACKQAAINSLIDVFALAESERLFYTDVTRGRTSGFSMLANYLYENKEVRLRFLGVDAPQDKK